MNKTTVQKCLSRNYETNMSNELFKFIVHILVLQTKFTKSKTKKKVTKCYLKTDKMNKTI